MPPHTPIEQQVERIWAEVLGRDRVGVDDDFLALGGHSLLAMQVVARVRDTWRIEVPLTTLLKASTVAHMAATIVHHMAHSIEAGALEMMLKEVEAMPGSAS